jgi:hypothetical protein
LGDAGEPNHIYEHAVELGLISRNPTGGYAGSCMPAPAACLQTSHSLLAPLHCAAERWWSSQFSLPGAGRPLSREEQAVVTHTLAAWSETVEGLQADAAGTTDAALRAAWVRLRASGRLEASPERLELAGRAWRWRELLQRAMDGCDSTSVQRWVSGHSAALACPR